MKTIEISDEAFAKLETAQRLRKEWRAGKERLDAADRKFSEFCLDEAAAWRRYLQGTATGDEFAEARKATLQAYSAIEAIPDIARGFNEARQDAIEAIALDLFPPL